MRREQQVAGQKVVDQKVVDQEVAEQERYPNAMESQLEPMGYTMMMDLPELQFVAVHGSDRNKIRRKLNKRLIWDRVI